ncbi:MAG: nucleotidyltransferase family protein [Intestinibacter sp.]|uniref:nucleotidyltransferase domain-containing protein n=1 Tax=Intestinibacter sp. TaxID=1965304 RepID=UPI002A82199E|nr:nucleotidyltransferase family protein [Intestinibacter sp.]MDY4573482.1 nucleotidyltransferase family protein [Intestinibacter sp.]
MLNYNYNFFIQLVNSFINNKPVKPEADVDWDEIIRLAKINNLLGIIFTCVDKMDKVYRPREELYKALKKSFLIQVRNSDQIEMYIKKVLNAFEKENIDHIFLKGYEIKHCYPIPELRSMSDVDVVIRREDRQKSDRVLKELGYEGNYTNCEVWDYRKKISYIEVHTSMVSDEIKQGIDYGEYFSNPWEHSLLKNKNTYKLDDEYHLIFLLVHMAKHFAECGCGVRMFLDIDFYLKKYAKNLNWNYIWGELNKLELVTFTEIIFTLCNKWFNSEIPIEPIELESDFYEKITENVLLGGVFGFELSNYKLGMVRQDLNKSNSYFKSSLKICKRLIFPSYEELIKQKQFSYLVNRRYLILFTWIYRLFYILITRGKKSMGYLSSILFGKSKVEEQSETMNKLGL